MAITPFKVTNFGTNRKPICDFLLVINTNLPLIMHRFQVMADYIKFSLASGGRYKRLRWGRSSANIAISDISLKLDYSSYISLAECIGVSSVTFT